MALQVSPPQTDPVFRRLLDRLVDQVIGMAPLTLGLTVTCAAAVSGAVIAGTLLTVVSAAPRPAFFLIPGLAALFVAPPLAGLLVYAIRRQRVTERGLRMSEDQLQLIARALPIPVVLSSWKDGRIIFANPALETLAGIEAGKGTGRSTLFSYADPKQRKGFQQALEAGDGRVHRYELSMVRPDGTAYTLHATAVRIRLRGEDAILSAVEDITEQKRLHAALQDNHRIAAQAAKRRALGTIAGGVSHELNNALLPIIMMSEDMLENLEDHSEAHRAVGSIKAAGERAAGIVQKVLTYSRPKKAQSATVDIAVEVSAARDFVAGLLPRDVRLESDIDPASGHCAIPATALKQILVNLAVNAYQAIGAEGIIRIELGPDSPREPRECYDGALAPGDYARLSVVDDGEGMTTEVRQRMFDPFFTTRSVGEGTGLGLAVVHGLVTQYGGVVGVASELGRGTRIDVYFPRADGRQADPGSQREE